MASKELNKRLQPIRAKTKDDSWEKLISAAHMEGVNLTAHYMHVKNFQLRLLIYKFGFLGPMLRIN